MAQIELSKEQLTALDIPNKVITIPAHQNLELKVSKPVWKNTFTLNKIDLSVKDKGICTGKFTQFTLGRKIKYSMANIKVRDVRGFTGEVWVPINFSEVAT